MAHWLDAMWRGRMSMRDFPLCRALDNAAGRRLSPGFPFSPLSPSGRRPFSQIPPR